jgi:glucokinase
MPIQPKASRIPARGYVGDADILAVLDAILASGGSVTVQELRRSISLPRPKLSAALRSLEQRGLIAREANSRNRVSLKPIPDGFVLAVDLGGTKLRAALADLHGNLLEDVTVPTVQTDITAQVVKLYDQLLKRSGRRAQGARAACVGIPAPYDPEGDSAWNVGNLPVLAESRPAASLARALEMPIVIAQDARLAAIGERWRGHARGLDDFVVICVGTGIGMGIVLNGELYGGGLGGAGEICFLPLGNDPFAPEHQVRGPFEDAVSGPALGRHYAEALGWSGNGASPPPDARAMFEAAAKGDALAVGEVQRAARLLALGIASVKATLDPELVVLGGGVGSNPGLLEPVRRNLERLTSRTPRLETSPLTSGGPLVGGIAIALGKASESLR